MYDSGVKKRGSYIPALLVFTTGLIFGITFSLVLIVTNIHNGKQMGYNSRDWKSDGTEDIKNALNGHSPDEEFHKNEDIVAAKLSKHIKILCLVITAPENFNTKTVAVNQTWGKRCSKLLFVSSKKNESFPVIDFPVPAGKQNVWGLAKEAFKYVYTNYLGTADWILRADDDTYVIMENLRYLLSRYNPDDALYLGCRFKKNSSQGYMSSGSGYVLSREAVKRLVEKTIFNKSLCTHGNEGFEEVEIGRCLENANVTPVDTRDAMGRYRFFPFNVETHIIPEKIPDSSWFWNTIYYPYKTGLDCCSDTAVSFNSVEPRKMILMEYFLYHLHPYGISHGQPEIYEKNVSVGKTKSM